MSNQITEFRFFDGCQAYIGNRYQRVFNERDTPGCVISFHPHTGIVTIAYKGEEIATSLAAGYPKWGAPVASVVVPRAPVEAEARDEDVDTAELDALGDEPAEDEDDDAIVRKLLQNPAAAKPKKKPGPKPKKKAKAPKAAAQQPTAQDPE